MKKERKFLPRFLWIQAKKKTLNHIDALWEVGPFFCLILTCLFSVLSSH